MALFGIGNILLKINRSRLPRPERATWIAVIIAIALTIAGVVGNAVNNPAYLVVFLQYFVPAALIVAIMLGRIGLLKVLLFLVHAVSDAISGVTSRLSMTIRRKIVQINSQQIVFFTRGDNVANLNQAVLYVRKNEHTNRLKVVTVVKRESDVPEQLKHDLEFLNRTYPNIEIEFVVIKGRFGPSLINDLSKKWGIPTNFMFIGSPGDHFLYGLAELGGVRLII